ncbi:uncharacterized protein BJ212DRAFT_1295572 [Suillus subaureus]|uniref:Uncharacterized protein n=1 Tax=Suillus subaureus TaxID=48587 RepID=A0A9P7ELC8_9AGAM|nr:uncharacterized protein BJ212DRAFT_1295572 [Suillus subaureus]KAG1824395.1 hypothetical protein BJ212DRAFT_1295572 [Suillus subaureus]
MLGFTFQYSMFYGVTFNTCTFIICALAGQVTTSCSGMIYISTTQTRAHVPSLFQLPFIERETDSEGLGLSSYAVPLTQSRGWLLWWSARGLLEEHRKCPEEYGRVPGERRKCSGEFPLQGNTSTGNRMEGWEDRRTGGQDVQRYGEQDI